MEWEVGKDLEAGQSQAVCGSPGLSRVGTRWGPRGHCSQFLVSGLGGWQGEALIEVLGELV